MGEMGCEKLWVYSTPLNDQSRSGHTGVFFSLTPRSRRDARSRAALFRTDFPQPPLTFVRALRDRRFVTRTRTFHAHTFKVRLKRVHGRRASACATAMREIRREIRLGCGVRSACARGHRARGAATRERGMVRVARGMDWGEYRACVARACAGGCARACRGGGDWGNHGGRHTWVVIVLGSGPRATV